MDARLRQYVLTSSDNRTKIILDTFIQCFPYDGLFNLAGDMENKDDSDLRTLASHLK